jgi:hypothetical protein
MKKFIIAVICGLFTTTALAQSYSKTERIYWLSQMWKDVADNFYNPERLAEIKWDSLYMSYIPLVENAEDDAEFYKHSKRFMALVQDGHTEFINNSEGRKPYTTPVAIEYINGAYYITGWVPEYFPGLTMPQEVLSINDMTVDAYLEEYNMPYVSGSTPQWRRFWALNKEFPVSDEPKEITLKLRDIKEKETTTTVTVPYKKWEEFIGQQPEGLANPHKSGYNFYEVPDKNQTNYFLLDFKGFLGYSMTDIVSMIKPRVEQCEYIVVDLRKNSGGSEPMADTLLMSLLSVDSLKTYRSQYREHNGLKAASGFMNFIPENRPYYENKAVGIDDESVFVKTGTGLPTFTQPLYVLIGTQTFSAAEDFLIPLIQQYPDRAVIIGTPTGGSTGAPLVRVMKEWDDGNSIIGYRICTRGAIVSDDYTQKGIQPQVYYDTPIEDYITGHDSIYDFVADYHKEHHK